MKRTSGGFALRVRLSTFPKFIRIFIKSILLYVVSRHNEKPGPCLTGPVASGILEAGPQR